MQLPGIFRLKVRLFSVLDVLSQAKVAGIELTSAANVTKRVLRLPIIFTWMLTVLLSGSGCYAHNTTKSPYLLPEYKESSSKVESFNDLPLGSIPVVAKAMLKDLPEEYQLRGNCKAFSMFNAAHDMDITFTHDRLQVTSEGKRWGMAMTGIGPVGSVKPVQKAVLINDDGMMVYSRGDVSEWYINSPWGVEQGFTIGSAPGGKNRDHLVVELSLSGELQPSLNGNTLVLADAQGKSIVRYTGLQVFDASGRSLPAHLLLTGSILRILVDDTHAIYPVTIDPWIQQAKLTPAEVDELDVFGSSAALSADTLVVGAHGYYGNSGSAYVFTRSGSGGAFTRTAMLSASDSAAGDHFGVSVAVNGDTIVVGANGNDDNGSYSGSAYVFVKPAGGWTDVMETAKLLPSDGATGDHFGISVAVSDDTIVVGAHLVDDSIAVDKGAAYVFVKPAGGWQNSTEESARISASHGNTYDLFGVSVATSGDTVVVGAHYHDGMNVNSGSAFVFAMPAGGWSDMTETFELTPNDAAGFEYFGNSIAMSGDTIVVGAFYDYAEDGSRSGAAYVFAGVAGTPPFTQVAKLTSTDRADQHRFGQSVAISGNTIIVGASGENDESGAAYIYAKPFTGWSDMTQTARLTAKDGAAGDYFGQSAAVSGNTAVVGAHGDDDNGSESGSAYVFEPDRFPWPMFLPAITSH